VGVARNYTEIRTKVYSVLFLVKNIFLEEETDIIKVSIFLQLGLAIVLSVIYYTQKAKPVQGVRLQKTYTHRHTTTQSNAQQVQNRLKSSTS